MERRDRTRIRVSRTGRAGHLSATGLLDQATGTALGDVAVFEALYAAHRRHVVAYCLRRARHADAYEAADETFLIAWRRLEDIPPGLERAWLYGVAYRVLGNQHRGERRRRRLTDRLAGVTTPAPIGDPEAEAVRSEDGRRLWRAYERLDPADQEVLRLAAWEGLGNQQLAAALGCGSDAARQRLHRARTRLARLLPRAERAKVTTGGAR
jgi:RNA polymerase sigma-70 factor, ECF subfamily